MTYLTIFASWFVLSIPIAVATGRYLRWREACEPRLGEAMSDSVERRLQGSDPRPCGLSGWN
jgi:hypothetical protein